MSMIDEIGHNLLAALAESTLGSLMQAFNRPPSPAPVTPWLPADRHHVETTGLAVEAGSAPSREVVAARHHGSQSIL